MFYVVTFSKGGVAYHIVGFEVEPQSFAIDSMILVDKEGGGKECWLTKADVPKQLAIKRGSKFGTCSFPCFSLSSSFLFPLSLPFSLSLSSITLLQGYVLNIHKVSLPQPRRTSASLSACSSRRVMWHGPHAGTPTST